MEKNVCGLDRAGRALLGLFLLWRLVRGRDRERRSIPRERMLAVYFLAELSVNVFAQWCPLNALLGVNTCRDE